MDKRNLTEQEKFYCHVNFYVLNRIWKHVHGKQGEPIETLYERLRITRNWYSKIQHEDISTRAALERKWNPVQGKHSQGLYNLGEGLKDHMLGKKLILFADKTQEDWERFMGHPTSTKGTQEKDSYFRPNFENDLKNAMRRLDGSTSNPMDMMYYFCKYGRSWDSRYPPYERIERLKHALSGLSMTDWESASDDLREDVCKLLAEQYDMASTMIRYKNFLRRKV